MGEASLAGGGRDWDRLAGAWGRSGVLRGTAPPALGSVHDRHGLHGAGRLRERRSVLQLTDNPVTTGPEQYLPGVLKQGGGVDMRGNPAERRPLPE